MDYSFIEKYNDLRDDILKMLERDSELAGEYAWLITPMQSGDINLSDSGEYIHCSGFTYTMQTGGCNEWFDFDILKADLELFQLKQKLTAP